MPNKPQAGITRIIAIVAFLAPVLASVYLAWWESYATEKTLNLNNAQDVMRRVEETSSQFEDDAQRLAQADLPPCSPQDIKLMRQVDLGSSYMKAVGRVTHDTLLCTSQGVTSPISLGTPDLVTGHDVSEYFNRNLAGEPSYPLNVVAVGGFAMIVDPRPGRRRFHRRPGRRARRIRSFCRASRSRRRPGPGLPFRLVRAH